MKDILYVLHRLGGRILVINSRLMTAYELILSDISGIVYEPFSSYCIVDDSCFLLMPCRLGLVFKVFGNHNFEGYFFDKSWQVSVSDQEHGLSQFKLTINEVEAISVLYKRYPIDPVHTWSDRETDDLFWWINKKRHNKELQDRYKRNSPMQSLVGGILVLKHEVRVIDPEYVESFKGVRTSSYSQLIFNAISAGKLNQVLKGLDGYRISEPSSMTAQSASGILQCLEAFALFDGMKVCLTEPLVALLKVGGHEEVRQVLSYIHQSALLKSKRDLLIDINLQKIVSEFNHHGYRCKDYWPESAVTKVNAMLAASGAALIF